MNMHLTTFATGQMPARARLVCMSRLGTRVDAPRPWNLPIHKRPARHLDEVLM